VLSRIGLGTSSLYARIREGLFPAPISLGVRCVAWRESDIDAWIADRIAKSQVITARHAPPR
jgi:prophage regulatory protein